MPGGGDLFDDNSSHQGEFTPIGFMLWKSFKLQ